MRKSTGRRDICTHSRQTDRTFETAGKKNDAYLQRNLIYVSNLCVCVYMQKQHKTEFSDTFYYIKRNNY